MVFDLLYRAGRDQTKRPLRERRARLEEIVAGAERIFPVRRLTSDGLVAWDEVLSTTVSEKLGFSWGTLAASVYAQPRERPRPAVSRVC